MKTFSLNLDTSIKNFQKTKYSQERPFQKEWEYYKQLFFQNFSEKDCVLTLMIYFLLQQPKQLCWWQTLYASGQKLE